MKKILVVTALLMFCIVPIGLFAENDAVDKGSFEFGLGTAFNLVRYSGNLEATEFTIGSGGTRLSIGYFIIDRLSIGGSFYYYSWKYEGDTESYTEYWLQPECKYYIPLSERVLVDLGGGFRIVSWEYPGDIDRSRRMYFGGGGGVTYLLTNNLGIYGGAAIVFSPNYRDEGTEVDDSSYTLFDLALGFRVYI